MGILLETAKEYVLSKGLNVYALSELSPAGRETVRLRPASSLGNLYSVSKTVTAVGIGMLVREGKLSAADKVYPFLKSYMPPEADEKWRRITVRDLLRHAWGQRQGDLFEGDAYTHGTDDWVKYVLSQPLEDTIGKKCVYSNASYYLLSLIAEKLAGETLFSYLRKNLFQPLSFKGYAAATCPLGHTMGATRFFLTVSDMATIGLLILHDGVLGGARYADAEFLQAAHGDFVPFRTHVYGYGLVKSSPWASDYFTFGAHGQLLYISPKRESVLAMQSYTELDEDELVRALEQAV